MKPLLLTVMTWIAVILGAVGLGVLGWGLWRLWKAARTRSWPTAQGTILDATVAKRDAMPPDRDEDPDPSRPRPPETLYRAVVTYSYRVSGRTFTSDRLTLEEVETSSESHARKLSERYTPGAPVTVHYDPADPTRAILLPGIRPASWLGAVIGLVFLVLSTAMLLFVRWWYLRK
jgi:hypothetical protein